MKITRKAPVSLFDIQVNGFAGVDFQDPNPDAGGKDFIESLNPNSLKVVTAVVEPSLAAALPGQQFQFERHGYFVADRIDHVPGRKPVFNLAVGLKDSWGK